MTQRTLALLIAPILLVLGSGSSHAQATTGYLTYGAGASIPSPLTNSPTIAVNGSLGNFFPITLTASSTLGCPTNITAGTYQTLVFIFTQDGAGGHTIKPSQSCYKAPRATGFPALTAAAGAIDMWTCVYRQAQGDVLCPGAAADIATFVPTFGNGGAPWPFVSQINAVNYDLGGQGVAFSHTYTNTNCTAGQSYRADYVNFNTTTDSGVTLDLGCISTVGDYFNYTVNIPATRNYTVNARVGESFAGAVWEIQLDGVAVTTVNVPNTGDYQTFRTQPSVGSFAATQGVHTIRVRCKTRDSASTGCGNIVFIQGV